MLFNTSARGAENRGSNSQKLLEVMTSMLADEQKHARTIEARVKVSNINRKLEVASTLHIVVPTRETPSSSSSSSSCTPESINTTNFNSTSSCTSSQLWQEIGDPQNGTQKIQLRVSPQQHTPSARAWLKATTIQKMNSMSTPGSTIIGRKGAKAHQICSLISQPLEQDANRLLFFSTQSSSANTRAHHSQHVELCTEGSLPRGSMSDEMGVRIDSLSLSLKLSLDCLEGTEEIFTQSATSRTRTHMQAHTPGARSPVAQTLSDRQVAFVYSGNVDIDKGEVRMERKNKTEHTHAHTQTHTPGAQSPLTQTVRDAEVQSGYSGHVEKQEEEMARMKMQERTQAHTQSPTAGTQSSLTQTVGPPDAEEESIPEDSGAGGVGERRRDKGTNAKEGGILERNGEDSKEVVLVEKKRDSEGERGRDEEGGRRRDCKIDAEEGGVLERNGQTSEEKGESERKRGREGKRGMDSEVESVYCGNVDMDKEEDGMERMERKEGTHKRQELEGVSATRGNHVQETRCTTTNCHTLQDTAAHCSTPQHTARGDECEGDGGGGVREDGGGVVWRSLASVVSWCPSAPAVQSPLTQTLRRTGVHCNTLQHAATYCSTLQHSATHAAVPAVCGGREHCNTLQHTATHCTTLQHSATLDAAVRGGGLGEGTCPLILEDAGQHIQNDGEQEEGARQRGEREQDDDKAARASQRCIMQYVAVCCSVLQCSLPVLQCVAKCCRVLQSVAVCGNSASVCLTLIAGEFSLTHKHINTHT